MGTFYNNTYCIIVFSTISTENVSYIFTVVFSLLMHLNNVLLQYLTTVSQSVSWCFLLCVGNASQHLSLPHMHVINFIVFQIFCSKSQLLLCVCEPCASFFIHFNVGNWALSKQKECYNASFSNAFWTVNIVSSVF